MEHGFLVRSSGTSQKVVLFFQKEYSKRALSRFILYLKKCPQNRHSDVEKIIRYF